MTSCVNFLSLPYQSRQGRMLDKTSAPLPPGAVALLNFAGRLYIIGGRSFNNADLAVTVRWGDETVYLNQANGIDMRGGDVRADLQPGIYDLVKVDPFGGEVVRNVVVKDGAALVARAGQAFIQVLYAFPAGLLTTEELEAHIVPINVRANWAQIDSAAADYIQNKPNFITYDDFNLIISTTIGETIEAEVGAQLAPVIDGVEAATDAANAAAMAAVRPVVNVFANHAAVAGQIVLCNSDVGAVTVTLPDAPVAGNVVTIARKGSNNVIVERNGKTIAYLSEDHTIDINKRGLELVYDGSTWWPFAQAVA